LGIAYPIYSIVWQSTSFIIQTFSPHTEETVMLDRTTYEYDGIFDRYGIKQKYVNPEETFFYRHSAGFGLFSKRRIPLGVNVIFKGDLLPLPENPLVFSEVKEALPWLNMSEGLRPVEMITSQGFTSTKKTVWISYADRVKFYMALEKEPKEDWVLTLKGSAFDAGQAARKLEILVFINNHEIGKWQIDNNSSVAEFTIPRVLLEESFEDEIRLVTIMMRIQGLPTFHESSGKQSTYGLHIEEMHIRPRAESSSK